MTMSGGSDVRDESVEVFREAAIEWAALGNGQVVVDAALSVLLADLDGATEEVSRLAGVLAASVDDEVEELLPDAARSLGVEVYEAQSHEAGIACARLFARRCLDGVMSTDQLTYEASRLWKLCRESSELFQLMGMNLGGDETAHFSSADWDAVDRGVREIAVQLLEGTS